MGGANGGGRGGRKNARQTTSAAEIYAVSPTFRTVTNDWFPIRTPPQARLNGPADSGGRCTPPHLTDRSLQSPNALPMHTSKPSVSKDA